uniref:G_PROTEIN_RECEP_F1_2 domain-containing protein n=1 Tax=Caenorhabditis japonica TaxID=281687 RepID=A0A8R1DVE6_CAEJA
MTSDANLTDFQCEYPAIDIALYTKIMLAVAYGLVGALSLVGNLAVLLIVVCRREMQTVTNIFISSVSAADLVITSFSLWATPLAYYQRVWYFGEYMCYMVSIIQGLSLMWVPLTLAAVALDRYSLVASPFRTPMKKKTCLLIIAGIWMGGFAALSPMIRMVEFVDTYGPCHFCLESWDHDRQHYRLFYGLSVLAIRSAIPLILISLCHWRIAVILNNQTTKFQTLRSAR